MHGLLLQQSLSIVFQRHNICNRAESLKTKKGETDLTESGAKAKIALNDLKDYPAKLKFLQNKRKNT